MKLSLKEMILAGIFAALTAICAQIAFKTPFSPVPVTMQTFGVFMAAVILGPKYGTLSQIVYLLLGSCGLPVFNSGQGGVQMLWGPTGGYLLSFPIIAFIIGFMVYKKKQVSRTDMIGLLLLGSLICYTIGTLQLALVAKLTMAQAISGGVLPFLPFDIMKLVAASYLGFDVRRALIKANLLKV